MKNLTEIRRVNLSTLISQFGLSTVAKRMRRSVSQIGDTASGRKSFGERVARAMEEAWDPMLEPGWLDRENGALAQTVDLPATRPDPDQKSVVTLSSFWLSSTSKATGVRSWDPSATIERLQVTREWLGENTHDFSEDKNLYLLTVVGDAMRPLLEPGDLLIVDGGVSVIESSGIYFFKIGNDPHVRHFQCSPRVGGGSVRVTAENPVYESWLLDKTTNLDLLGRVVGVLGKKY